MHTRLQDSSEASVTVRVPHAQKIVMEAIRYADEIISRR
jgi:hypothetical protein